MSFQRQDDAQRKSHSPASLRQIQEMTARGPQRAKVPTRGSVLCALTQPELQDAVESHVLQHGYSLLRAQPGIHGLWLAITGKPDAILTDIPTPGPDTESAYLMECLHRNRKTKDIPVIALINAGEQKAVGNSGLQHATLCIDRDAPVEELLKRLDTVVEASRENQRRENIQRTAEKLLEVDAVFSQMGSAELGSIEYEVFEPMAIEVGAMEPEAILSAAPMHFENATDASDSIEASDATDTTEIEESMDVMDLMDATQRIETADPSRSVFVHTYHAGIEGPTQIPATTSVSVPVR